MSRLLDKHGNPISVSSFKKEKAPQTGPAFGNWAGRDVTYLNLPGGGLIGFDLSKLQVEDFRTMRDHYQVNSSLAILSFMQHQSEWTIECENTKIKKFCEEQMRNIWTPLNRALATANWAGYAPNVLEWENNIEGRSVDLDKIKDLIPEECSVNWKEVPGWSPPGILPPKFKIYDGFNQWGARYPVPVENSLWYPLLMENGNYYGRKLLRPAFIPWYFSILMHLFSNRYYERFGEPVPIGRADFDDEINLGDGKKMAGNKYMLTILEQLRNRSVVVLPNDFTDFGNGRLNYNYEIEYLESQMRGADFERYLTRLDEEISIGMFTPILLMRTADVGSYNLGVGHMQMYLWMLNAMNDDRKFYIDKYILSRMTDFNFSLKAPRPRIHFRKMGNQNSEILRTVVAEMMSAGKMKPDLIELGQLTGMTLTEVKGTVDDGNNGSASSSADDSGNEPSDGVPNGTGKPRETEKKISARVGSQVEKAFRQGKFGPGYKISIGYRNQMRDSIPDAAVEKMYGRMDSWLVEAVSLGSTAYSSPEEFTAMFERVLAHEVAQASQ